MVKLIGNQEHGAITLVLWHYGYFKTLKEAVKTLTSCVLSVRATDTDVIPLLALPCYWRVWAALWLQSSVDPKYPERNQRVQLSVAFRWARMLLDFPLTVEVFCILCLTSRVNTQSWIHTCAWTTHYTNTLCEMLASAKVSALDG